MVKISIYTLKQVKEKSAMYDLESKKIGNPSDAKNLIETVLGLKEEAVENFGIITLNTKNIVVGIHVISIGSLNSAIVHPREVFKAALLNNAASIICFHNHPSGDPTPSAEDIELTKRLCENGNLMGIELLDHIIIGDDAFTSLKEQGYM